MANFVPGLLNRPQNKTVMHGVCDKKSGSYNSSMAIKQALSETILACF